MKTVYSRVFVPLLSPQTHPTQQTDTRIILLLLDGRATYYIDLNLRTVGRSKNEGVWYHLKSLLASVIFSRLPHPSSTSHPGAPPLPPLTPRKYTKIRREAKKRRNPHLPPKNKTRETTSICTWSTLQISGHLCHR